MELYYAGGIPAEGFHEKERPVLHRGGAGAAARQAATEALGTDQEARFEKVTSIHQVLDVEAIWAAETIKERRVLVEELLDTVAAFPDHLEVKASGVPTLNVLYGEVGMKASENVGVGERKCTFSDWRLDAWGSVRRGDLAVTNPSAFHENEPEWSFTRLVAHQTTC